LQFDDIFLLQRYGYSAYAAKLFSERLDSFNKKDGAFIIGYSGARRKPKRGTIFPDGSL